MRDVYDRGGVVGGTSAGEAILGQYVFDAVAEGNKDTTTRNAVRNPYERLISFTYGFLRFPALHDAITDQHFVTRNRFGDCWCSWLDRLQMEGCIVIRSWCSAWPWTKPAELSLTNTALERCCCKAKAGLRS